MIATPMTTARPLFMSLNSLKINTPHMNSEIATSVLYTSIHKLPLCRFIDVAVDEHFHSLVISGNPSPEEMKSAWDDILLQYNDAIGATKGNKSISAYK